MDSVPKMTLLATPVFDEGNDIVLDVVIVRHVHQFKTVHGENKISTK